jgi:hypothetical protein
LIGEPFGGDDVAAPSDSDHQYLPNCPQYEGNSMMLLAAEYGDVFSHNIAAAQEYWRTAMSRLREEPNEQDEPLARRAERTR